MCDERKQGFLPKQFGRFRAMVLIRLVESRKGKELSNWCCRGMQGKEFVLKQAVDVEKFET